MSSVNMFSSNQGKPQRRLGRRSMALNSTTNTNTTLNGTLNATGKYNMDFSHQVPYEPSCASTPLPDHTKNKENIFLSSIKPVMAGSPKSARKVPYQTQRVRRLGRRSMALRAQETENACLNDSLTRMKDINASLKLGESKPESTAVSSQPAVPTFQSSVNSFLNYDFLKKYFPSSASTTAASPKQLSPLRFVPKSTAASPKQLSPLHFKPKSSAASPKQPSPMRFKSKYESLLKNVASKCEMITEATSESPTTEIHIPCVPEKDEFEEEEFVEEKDDFLKKSLTGGRSKGGESPTMDYSESSKYGSFLGDMSPPEEQEDKLVERKCEKIVKASGSSAQSEGGDALNRTFEMEDDNLLFKTPVPPKFFKREEFKTPMSSVFSRFQNTDDQNDSFVENERTIMLQFRNEAPRASIGKQVNLPSSEHEKTGGTSVVSVVSASNVSASASDVLVSTNTTALSMSDKTNSSMSNNAINKTVDTISHSVLESTTSTSKDYTVKTLQDLVAKQQKQLATFMEEQAKQLTEFLGKQNIELNIFIANMGNTEQNVTRDCTLQNESVPSIVISEAANTTVGRDKSVVGDTTFNGEVTVGNTTVNDTTVATIGELSAQDTQHSTTLSETMQDEDTTTHFRPKTRQSIAFSNFKRNCSILKTPSRSRRSMADTTAVFTPGSLSVCIRDQLEALEKE